MVQYVRSTYYNITLLQKFNNCTRVLSIVGHNLSVIRVLTAYRNLTLPRYSRHEAGCSGAAGVRRQGKGVSGHPACSSRGAGAVRGGQLHAKMKVRQKRVMQHQQQAADPHGSWW